ncbi:hypothetical protein BDC45DRAFT_495462 [Circinella umbellata]|nr:hypothetical protein BDC45DRAFT_495462 [Circinella umbellata]
MEYHYYQQQQQQQQELSFAQQEEQAYFDEYDRAFDQATLEADYYDAYYEQEDQEDETMMEIDQVDNDEQYYYNEENNNMNDINAKNDIMNDNEQEQQEEGEETQTKNSYDYQRDSLLHLIVGVQSYLSDASALNMDRNDSPLADLQYKMYTYLKQRACDMGVDMDTTGTQL